MKENIPDYVPMYCNADCKHYSGFFTGKCNFYGEDVTGGWHCIATERFNVPHTGSTNKCPKCEKPQIKKAVFCKDCGAEISPRELVTIAYCDECESEYDMTYKFCNKDGTQLIRKEVEKEGQKDSRPVKGEMSNDKLGFGWGKFLIVMGFIQGGIAFIFSIIMGVQTPQLPNKGVGLLISILGFGSAYGLMNRKLFGLYLVYANLIGMVVWGLIGLVSGEEIFIIQGVIAIVISILCFIYFNKRKGMFS